MRHFGYPLFVDNLKKGNFFPQKAKVRKLCLIYKFNFGGFKSSALPGNKIFKPNIFKYIIYYILYIIYNQLYIIYNELYIIYNQISNSFNM